MRYKKRYTNKTMSTRSGKQVRVGQKSENNVLEFWKSYIIFFTLTSLRLSFGDISETKKKKFPNSNLRFFFTYPRYGSFRITVVIDSPTRSRFLFVVMTSSFQRQFPIRSRKKMQIFIKTTSRERTFWDVERSFLFSFFS